VHLKRRAGVDIDATDVPVIDATTRRRVLEHLAARWYRTPTPIEELVELAPMVEVHVG
jgi:hypothetical protein